nr:MAG TPA: hypothetical protein [Caudoviricetes sp.]
MPILRLSTQNIKIGGSYTTLSIQSRTASEKSIEAS